MSAAEQHGCSQITLVKELGRNQQMLECSGWLAGLARWYSNEAKCEIGKGYPNGTLLWYR